jgi:beta-phosphoglucomutase family hydrolase
MIEQRAFIFDMDGTLVDNMEVHTQIWLEMLLEHGVAMTAEEFHHRASGKPNERVLREVFDGRMSKEETAAFAARKEARYRVAYGPQMRPVRGLPRFLAAAQRLRVPMSLATSAGSDNIAFVLGGLEIEHIFHAVVGAEDVTHGKPDPEMFLLAAERMGVDPRGCLVFEDAPAGIEAASRAGMRAIAVATTAPAHTYSGLKPVVRVIEDFTSVTPEGLLAEIPL